MDAERGGIYGTSYGGAMVVWVGAVDPRVKCVVSVVGTATVGAGCAACAPDESTDCGWFRRRSRAARGMGESEFVHPKRDPAARPAVCRPGCSGSTRQSRRGGRDPLEFVDDTLGFHPSGWSTGSRHARFCSSPRRRRRRRRRKARRSIGAPRPKKLIVPKGFGHSKCTPPSPSGS